MYNTNWIWTPEWSAEDKTEPRIVYFRKLFRLDEVPVRCMVQISADSRYKLYVNGVLAELGPCKGDDKIWYYDTVDLLSFLRSGLNVLAVQVLRYPLERSRGNGSIFRTHTPGLYLTGEYQSADGTVTQLAVDASWKCHIAPNITFLPDSPVMQHLYIYESSTGDPETAAWMEPTYDDNGWLAAEPQLWPFIANRTASPSNLEPRRIPYMNRIPRRFKGTIAIRTSNCSSREWDEMLTQSMAFTIPPHSKEVVEIDAGELMTGYLKLRMRGGEGTKVKLLQSEAYVLPGEASGQPKKGNRMDYIHGRLHGRTDSYSVAGYGTAELEECFEPFWFRTFRFIQLEVVTAAAPLTLTGFDYQETGYPLEVKTWVKTSDPSMEAVWDISERSLRRCMHETYEDCPFYEQLQYAMDTRAQILYTYMVSADDRLARKAFDDFKQSRYPNGMINCCYPSTNNCIIPGFSIYYILMLHDHMMFFGDRGLLRSHLSTVDGILEYFHMNLAENGLVGKIGGHLFRDAAWSFIDWTAQWDVPNAGLKGPITMESLLYILGLQRAAEIAAFTGRDGIAAEYKIRAEMVRNAIRRCCMGWNGMVQDGPGVEEYSQHCQVFALLTGTVSLEQGRNALIKTLEDKQQYAQCSYAMAFYLFRALEQCGLYAYTNAIWDGWREMVRNNLTTCVEDPVGQRSDCHAWGALALYELPAVVLGVRPTKPGFEEFEVKPVPGHFTWAEGEVITPRGIVRVCWEKNGENLNLFYKLTEETGEL